VSESKRYRILFVDDEQYVLDALCRDLEPQLRVWDLEFVQSGVLALERMAAEEFDAVVTDYRMPGMDGARLLRVVKERHPDTARLMLAGKHDGHNLLGVLSVTNCLLDKPCDRDLLVDAIEHALKSRG
jgi:CheY-like chemotaxis protein